MPLPIFIRSRKVGTDSPLCCSATWWWPMFGGFSWPPFKWSCKIRRTTGKQQLQLNSKAIVSLSLSSYFLPACLLLLCKKNKYVALLLDFPVLICVGLACEWERVRKSEKWMTVTARVRVTQWRSKRKCRFNSELIYSYYFYFILTQNTLCHGCL